MRGASIAMNVLIFSVLSVLLLSALTNAKIDPENLQCLVCRSTVDEVEKSIMNTNPKKTVEVGNYRLDGAGNMHQNRVPLSKSQVYLSEILDDVCKKMSDYVRVRYKATQKLAVMKMMSDSGGMNPEFSLTDFVTDDDLNKSLEFYCEGIVGENEDHIVDLYSKRVGDSMPDGKIEICEKHIKLCKDWMLPNAEDLNWSPEKQQQSFDAGHDPYGFGNYMPPENQFDNQEEDAGDLEMETEEKDEL